MEFEINTEAPIKWPDKCVWCLDVPAKEMKAQAGWIWQKRVKIGYPLCGKHYFLIRGAQIIDLVIFVIWVSPLSKMPYEVILPIVLLILWILSLRFKPVKIRVRGDFYTMEIRNDDYAREFAMLNNLNPQ